MDGCNLMGATWLWVERREKGRRRVLLKSFINCVFVIIHCGNFYYAKCEYFFGFLFFLLEQETHQKTFWLRNSIEIKVSTLLELNFCSQLYFNTIVRVPNRCDKLLPSIVIFLNPQSQRFPNKFWGYNFLCKDCFHSLKALMLKKPITRLKNLTCSLAVFFGGLILGVGSHTSSSKYEVFSKNVPWPLT